MQSHLERAKKAKRESKYIDFKRSFSPQSQADWCEILKDIVAMSNSGGGCIVFGINNDLTPYDDCDVPTIRAIDPAVLVDKINKYTGVVFDGVTIETVMRGNQEFVTFLVEQSEFPIIFSKVGTYSLGDGKQKNAFSQGTLYVRHGAKSEPAVTDDVRCIFERKLEETRKAWAEGVRQVTEAPIGSQIDVVYSEYEDANSSVPTTIRLVNDPSAPAFRQVSIDDTHPFRQTELIKRVNALLKSIKINSYDIQSIRHAYNIDDIQEFKAQPRYGSAQYSDDFAHWIVDQYKNNPKFFNECRTQLYQSKFV